MSHTQTLWASNTPKEGIFSLKIPEAPLDGCLLAPTECAFIASSGSYLVVKEGGVLEVVVLVLGGGGLEAGGGGGSS